MAVQDLPEIKKIISIGKANGEITYDEINEYLPEKIVNSERIDDVFTLLNQMGIEVVEEYESGSKTKTTPLAQVKKAGVRKKKAGTQKSVDDDPIRVYLKEIGKVSLISGDKEVFLARRIENGENLIEEAILSSTLVRANFLKLLPKVRSGKLKISEVVRASKSYYLTQAELERLKKKFLGNMAIVEREERNLYEAYAGMHRYTEGSKKWRDYKNRVDKTQKIIDSAITSMGISQKEILRISQKLSPWSFVLKIFKDTLWEYSLNIPEI